MKIEIVVDGRTLSTQSNPDSPKHTVEDTKRRVLKEALASRQLRISEALRARIVISDEQRPVTAPTSLWQQTAALAAARGKGNSKG